MSDMITAWILDGHGNGREVTAPQDFPAHDDSRLFWVHLDRTGPSARDLARRAAPLPEVGMHGLFAEDTRPRCEETKEGLLINLRGVNMNPGADPRDLISVRLWVTQRRIVSVRRYRMMSVDDIRKRLAEGDGSGPVNVGDFLVQLAEGLTARLGPLIERIDETLDAAEEADERSALSREELSETRRALAALRRFLAPQQSALGRLAGLGEPWLTEGQRTALRYTLDDVTRYLEDLDALRDRAGILRDALAEAASDRMNRTMYLLTLVAGIFLPLGFVTGLLGINVGGMPGAESGSAFWLVTLGLAGFGVAEVLFLKWRRLL